MEEFLPELSVSVCPMGFVPGLDFILKWGLAVVIDNWGRWCYTGLF